MSLLVVRKEGIWLRARVDGWMLKLGGTASTWHLWELGVRWVG